MAERTTIPAVTTPADVCGRCRGTVIVERERLRTHRTCMRCGNVETESERSIVHAMLLFMARG